MKYKIVLFSVFLSSLTLFGQEKIIVEELNGFRLGQYKTVVDNQLGERDSFRYLDDSTLVNFYYIFPDSSTHMAFFYLPKKNEIHSIQLTGTKSDLSFYGITLGASSEYVASKFEKPDTIFEVDFNGEKTTTWKYYDKNLSFVFNKDVLSSIKIWDMYTPPDYESKDYKLPRLVEYLEIIKSADKLKISNILSPNLEIFYCDKVFQWQNSFYKDIYEKEAAIYYFVVNPEAGLALLNKLDTIPGGLNIRLIDNVGSFPVYKLPDGYFIKEVVFNFQQGRYKIWEIKYECLDDK